MPTCTRSTYARAEGTQSVTIFISSNEGIHTITLRPSTSHLYSHKLTGSYRASALSPVPHIPARLPKSHRLRQQIAVYCAMGGSGFKAVRRAKRTGRSVQGEIGGTVWAVAGAEQAGPTHR